MSGWFWVHSGSDGSRRAARFAQRFAVPGVPEPHLRHFDPARFGPTGWMWRREPDWADLVFAQDIEAGVQLLLDGYITGGGELGEPADAVTVGDWLLRCWSARGEAMLPELNGSFSLTVADRRSGLLHLATDRWSSRPLWYAVESSGALAANNAATLAAIWSGSLHLDRAATWSLLAGNRPVADRSIYHEIRRVPAGTVLVIDGRGVRRSRRWFELRYEPETGVSSREWGRRIAQGLRDSAAAIAAVGKPNIFLSGGLDSRIASGAFGARAASTTIISGKNLSSRVAEQVAAQSGSQHTTLVRDDNWYLDTFAASALLSGGSYNVHHAHFYQAIARLPVAANEHFVLGDLAENFNEHYWKIDEQIARGLTADAMVERYHELDKYAHKKPTQLRALFAEGVAGALEDEWRTVYRDVVAECFKCGRDPRDVFDALFRWHDNYVCPTNLMLECIKPVAGHANLMFDNRMLDLLRRVPTELKSRGVLHKKILRELDPGLLWIPNSNFWLPPAFPAWVESANRSLRRKIRPLMNTLRGERTTSGGRLASPGSWHVMYHWYWHDAGHRDFLHNLINDNDALPDELFDRQALRASLAAFEAGDVKRHYELYPLISFGLLHRQLPAVGLQGD